MEKTRSSEDTALYEKACQYLEEWKAAKAYCSVDEKKDREFASLAEDYITLQRLHKQTLKELPKDDAHHATSSMIR